jgi:hypothetical protein
LDVTFNAIVDIDIALSSGIFIEIGDVEEVIVLIPM